MAPFDSSRDDGTHARAHTHAPRRVVRDGLEVDLVELGAVPNVAHVVHASLGVVVGE